MVGREYMLGEPPPRPEWKRFIDLTLIPAAANEAAAVEGVLERVAAQARVRPVMVTCLAFAAGCAAAALLAAPPRAGA